MTGQVQFLPLIIGIIGIFWGFFTLYIININKKETHLLKYLKSNLEIQKVLPKIGFKKENFEKQMKKGKHTINSSTQNNEDYSFIVLMSPEPVKIEIKENYPHNGVSSIEIKFPEYFDIKRRIDCASEILDAINNSF